MYISRVLWITTNPFSTIMALRLVGTVFGPCCWHRCLLGSSRQATFFCCDIATSRSCFEGFQRSNNIQCCLNCQKNYSSKDYISFLCWRHCLASAEIYPPTIQFVLIWVLVWVWVAGGSDPYTARCYLNTAVQNQDPFHTLLGFRFEVFLLQAPCWKFGNSWGLQTRLASLSRCSDSSDFLQNSKTSNSLVDL